MIPSGNVSLSGWASVIPFFTSAFMSSAPDEPLIAGPGTPVSLPEGTPRIFRYQARTANKNQELPKSPESVFPTTPQLSDPKSAPVPLSSNPSAQLKSAQSPQKQQQQQQPVVVEQCVCTTLRFEHEQLEAGFRAIAAMLIKERPDECVGLQEALVKPTDVPAIIRELCRRIFQVKSLLFHRVERDEPKHTTFKHQRHLGDGNSSCVFNGKCGDITTAAKVFTHRGNIDHLSEIALCTVLSSHPGCVRVYGAYHEELENDQPNKWVLVMEKATCTLGEFLDKRESRAPAAESRLSMALQLHSALKFMHSVGVVHLDLRPKNILVIVDPDPSSSLAPLVRLCDFGHAAYSPNPHATFTRPVIRDAYTPPEVRHSQQLHSMAVDIWAFGLLVYQLWYCVSSVGEMDKFQFGGFWFLLSGGRTSTLPLVFEKMPIESPHTTKLDDICIDDIDRNVDSLVRVCLVVSEHRPALHNLHHLCALRISATKPYSPPH